jgi:tetratricopeptide (TPR) repeat protein
MAVIAAGLPWPARAAGDGMNATESIIINGAANNSKINNTVNHENPATLKLLAKILSEKDVSEDRQREAEAKTAELAQKLGFTSSAVTEFFKILGMQDVPEEQVPTRLIEIATHFAETRSQLAALEPDDPHAAELARSSQQALDAGRLAEADELLNRANDAELAASRQALELARKAQQAADHHALTAAKLLAGRGNIAMTQLRYDDAAGVFRQAAALVPPGQPDATADLLESEAEALFYQGDERGNNTALQQSIETWQAALGYRSRELVPVDWAMIETNLGSALERLGEREDGTDRLKEAVAAYRAALPPIAIYYAAIEEDTHDRVSWVLLAGTQMNLGAALETLGERDPSQAWLEESIAAYHAALSQYARDDAPLQQALTEINLGNALQTLGERQGNVAQFEDAIAAYHAALEKCTRERVPLQWALAQNNLGKALWVLGREKNRTELLEQSITAYRAALEVRTRDRVPLDWAMTENNLAIALKTLGERESGTGRLQEAVSAYQSALEEYTPERVPLRWAMTEMNLGNLLLILGKRENSNARLEQAVAAYRGAVERDPLPIDRSSSQFNMGLALVALGKPAQALDCFRQSEAVFRAAGMSQPAAAASQWIARLQQQAGTSALAACIP